MTLQHSSRQRGKIEMPDSPLPELSRLDILQKTIREADRIIELGDLPEHIRLAEQMKARAQAEIQELVNADIEAHTSAAYGQAGEELGTRWIMSGGEPYEIVNGVSRPAWFENQSEIPF